jgi:hypothetical protein
MVQIGNMLTFVPGLSDLVQHDDRLHMRLSYPDTPEEYKMKHVYKSERPVPPIVPVHRDEIPTATFLHHYDAIMEYYTGWEDTRTPPDVTMDGLDPSQLVGKQHEILTEMIDGRMGWGGLILASTSSGKEQPVDTPILTPEGWTTMGALKVGDYVVGSNGKPTQVLAIYPQGVKPAYRVTFGDGASVEAGADHLWTVERSSTGRYHTVRTQDLRPAVLNATNRLVWKDRIPMLSAPVEFAGADPAGISGYELGYFIGNGSLLTNRNCQVVIYCDSRDADDVKNQFSSATDGYTPKGTRSHRFAPGLELQQYVWTHFSREDAEYKHIPREALHASPAFRVALLQGLMDADGTISKSSGSLSFSTCVEPLVQQVSELVEGLGGSVRVRSYDRRGQTYRVGDKQYVRKSVEYELVLKLPTAIAPFRLVRKALIAAKVRGKCAEPQRPVISVEYVRDVEQQCIRVAAPDRLYVTDHCILTHNTFIAGHYCRQLKGRAVFFVDDQLLGQQTRDDLQRVLQEPVGLVGAGKHDVQRVTVCLFQSSHTKAAKLLQGADVVFVDEVHTQINARALRAVHAVEPKVVFGLTGTFDLDKPYKKGQLLQLLSSPEIIYYTPGEALAAKVVTKVLTFGVSIPMVVATDGDLRPLDLHKKYIMENEWLHAFTAELTFQLSLEKFSPVVFCHYREHISRVCAALRPYGLHPFEHSGRISKSRRYSKRKEMSATKTEDVLVATNATFAKGASVHTLSAGVGVSQGNWEGTIQSIGRLMRLHETKPYAVYFDVALTSPPGRYGISLPHPFAISAHNRRKHVQATYPYQEIVVDSYKDPVAEAKRVWNVAASSLRS